MEKTINRENNCFIAWLIINEHNCCCSPDFISPALRCFFLVLFCEFCEEFWEPWSAVSFQVSQHSSLKQIEAAVLSTPVHLLFDRHNQGKQQTNQSLCNSLLGSREAEFVWNRLYIRIRKSGSMCVDLYIYTLSPTVDNKPSLCFTFHLITNSRRRSLNAVTKCRMPLLCCLFLSSPPSCGCHL